jgi:hypothetical protein
LPGPGSGGNLGWGCGGQAVAIVEIGLEVDQGHCAGWSQPAQVAGKWHGPKALPVARCAGYHAQAPPVLAVHVG